MFIAWEAKMDFLRLAMEARSCRRFDESAPLAMPDLLWLIECARFAPCGRNAQELRFILIGHGAVCEELFSLTRWAGALKDWKGPQPGERPTAFIATLMPERGGNILCYDVGIACQTMQLAATSRGWGACMIQSFEYDPCRKLLNAPDGMRIALLLGLGLAREKRVVEPMPPSGSFAYWRDEAGVHHVPKRSVEELVLARFGQ